MAIKKRVRKVANKPRKKEDIYYNYTIDIELKDKKKEKL